MTSAYQGPERRNGRGLAPVVVPPEGPAEHVVNAVQDLFCAEESLAPFLDNSSGPIAHAVACIRAAEARLFKACLQLGRTV